MVAIKNLSKKFGNRKVLDRLSVDLDEKVYGLLAPNGAGKTTLLRFLTTVYPTKPNTIFYNNEDIITLGDSFRNLVGYLPQNFGMPKEFSIYEALNFIGIMKKIPKNFLDDSINEVLEKVNLVDSSSVKIKKLSGGMLRRLGVAQALLGDPKIIVFDEPTAGLDPEERMRFKNVIENIKKDHIIVISTHIVSDVETLCDEIMIMSDGKIFEKNTCEAIASLAYEHCYEVPDEEYKKIKGDFSVQSQYRINEKMFFKIVSPIEQEFRLIQPTLEDGYIWALKYMQNI